MRRAVPHDPALPQLARALDPEAMAPLLGAELAAGLRMLACDIEHVTYRPRRSCSVAYRLRLRQAGSGREFEQRVAARCCRGGESARRYLRAGQRGGVASPAGPALSHWPALEMVAHWLPNDARLDAMALLHDDEALRSRCLREVVDALTDGHGRLVDHRSTLVQVVPGLRACARIELRLRPGPGAAIRTRTLFAKADVERDGAVAHAVMQALSRSPAQADGRLCTPRPLLWQPASGLHWQLAVPGRALRDADPSIGADASARVGERLAALHATAVPAAPALASGTLRERLDRCVSLLGDVQASWRPRLARLASRLDAGLAALATQPAVTLHGDLHPRNILVDGSRLAFIDLDGVHTGPAALELGGWVADAMSRAVLQGLPPDRAAPSWRAFLQAYARAAGGAPDASLLACGTAHQLLCRRAWRCVAKLKPGRYQVVPALLALAEAIAAEGRLDAVMPAALEAA